MAHLYIEIAYDSRKIETGTRSAKQTIVLGLCLDPEIEPVFNSALGMFLGYEDDVAMLEYAFLITPNFRILPSSAGTPVLLERRSLTMDQKAPNYWEVTVDYQFDLDRGMGNQNNNNSNGSEYIKMNFSIGGGQKTIKRALDQIGPTVIRQDLVGKVQAEDTELAIGVTENSITGVSVPSSLFRLQITGYFFPSFVTFAYAKTLAELVAGKNHRGTYNNATFLGQASGEVQFLGASGGGSLIELIPITFEFSISPNLSGEPDPGFGNFTAKGHDLVDYIFTKEIGGNGKRLLMLPQQRNILRIHDSANYNLIGLPL